MNTQSLSIADLPDRCEGDIRLHIPQEFRRGRDKRDERRSIESAVENLKAIAAKTERPDWSKLQVLDFGCGVKFTQALVQYDVDVKAYVGMDVFTGLIECLRQRVARPNFCFEVVPFHNEMYNPKGVELTADAALPGGLRAFDLITLQSVFTHFKPADFLALLHVLRRHAVRDARLFFTCFIDNEMEPDFFDSVPHRPLAMAYYKERFVREMLDESGWRPLALYPPASSMKHHFVCETQ